MDEFIDTENLISLVIAVAVVAFTYWYFKIRNATTNDIPMPIPQAPTATSTKKINKKGSQKEEVDEDPSKLRIKIFYGTQTGTAEEFSRKLESEGKKFGFQCKAVDLEDYEPEELSKEKLVLFCVATYGEGEPTDNARAFHEWMNQDHSSDEMNGVKFAVFGLGNRTYEKFNSMAKYLDKRMEELGGERVFKIGLGDDDSSLEDDFAAWKKELWPSLCQLFGMDFENVDLGSGSAEKRFKVEFLEGVEPQPDDNLHVLLRKRKEDGPIDAKNPFPGIVVVNKELHTAESDRSCRHVEVFIGKKDPKTDTEVPAITYEPGDHLGIYPDNDPEVVLDVCKRLELNPEQYVNISNIKEKGKFVFEKVKIKDILGQWCDLTTPPRKAAIAALVSYATDANEKSKLLELSDSKATQPYESWVKDSCRTIGEILNDFPSIKGLTLDHFLDIVPRLNPRYYSISSSQSKHPLHVHATAVVVNYTTTTGRKHKGVCTTYLSHKRPEVVPVFVRKSTFRLPKNPETPVVMVGPGTGLAPFRGFIQERQHQTDKGELEKGNTHLFFGCRSPKVDFIYADELTSAHDKGHIRLYTAFSRHDNKKTYVQHLLKDNGEDVYKLIHEEKGHFYICGDARNMAKEVHSALVDIISQYGGKTKEESEKFVTELQKSGKYQTDVWY